MICEACHLTWQINVVLSPKRFTELEEDAVANVDMWNVVGGFGSAFNQMLAFNLNEKKS